MRLALLLLALAPLGDPTPWERALGWRPLLDGSTLAGWEPAGEDGWAVQDGAIVRRGGGQDLVSVQTFEDFELELEWRVAPGGNSGIKYRVPAGTHVGPEYQIVDAAHPDAADPRTGVASLYGVVDTAAAPPPAGRWNRARIVARGSHLEHWLNGERAAVAEVGGADWDARVADSKFRDVAGFGAGRGHLRLQDHGDAVAFRALRVRDLADPPGRAVDLLLPHFEAWRPLGDAVYDLEDGEIRGRVGGGGQSFLVTREEFGDFLLEVDVRTERPGNSGIQVRSHVDEAGTLFGYQVEIDPSERAWSGGLYDEARRGWLQDLSDDPAARAAFDPGAWNRYRIECVGPWIRTWVNGVPIVDYVDGADLAGKIALQVHSGDDTDVRWRDLRLRDLGTRRWEPFDVDPAAEPWSTDPAGSWRLEEGRLVSTGGALWRPMPADYLVRYEWRHESLDPDLPEEPWVRVLQGEVGGVFVLTADPNGARRAGPAGVGLFTLRARPVEGYPLVVFRGFERVGEAAR